MGCRSWVIRGVSVRVAEYNDDWPCLCTYKAEHGIEDVGRLRTLVAFGALVVKAISDGKDGEYLYIPTDLPERFLSDLNRLAPVSPP